MLHVLNTAEVGGGSEHLLHLVQGLGPRGIESAVVVGRDGPVADRLRQAGAPVVVVPLGIAAPLLLANAFRRIRPSCLHLHGSRSGLAGTLAARVARIRPVVYTAHAFAFRRRLPPPIHWAAVQAETLTCRLADRVICLSQGDLGEAAARGIPTSRFTVIPNGVSSASFMAARARRGEFGWDATVPVVGMISRLVPQKDPLTFLRMAQLVAEAIPDVRFLLVGDGPLRPTVEHAVKAMGLDRRVIVAGLRDDVAALLQTMDVVVLTSLWEGLPLTLLEAMAASKPVVATRVQGSTEVVVEGETGFLVPPEQPAQIALAVVNLLRDPALRQRMGRKGYERVERSFSVERMVDATVGVYRALLRNQGDGSSMMSTEGPHGGSSGS